MSGDEVGDKSAEEGEGESAEERETGEYEAAEAAIETEDAGSDEGEAHDEGGPGRRRLAVDEAVADEGKDEAGDGKDADENETDNKEEAEGIPNRNVFNKIRSPAADGEGDGEDDDAQKPGDERRDDEEEQAFAEPRGERFLEVWESRGHLGFFLADRYGVGKDGRRWVWD